MKALSLWQPWASAVAFRWKRLETRHWSTAYRGPIAIHAAKRWTSEERLFWADVVERHDLPDDFLPPLGAIVAVARLADVRRSEILLHEGLSEQERRWGNYAPRRFGWLLEEVQPLPAPIPYRGEQGLFEIPDCLFASDYVPAAAACAPPPLARQELLL